MDEIQELEEKVAELEDQLEHTRHELTHAEERAEECESHESRLVEYADYLAERGVIHNTPAGKARWIREGR